MERSKGSMESVGGKKRQVVVLHGGTSFADHDQYMKWLREVVLEKERLLPGPMGWKEWLGTGLGSAYEVLLPRMPNATNAVYEEWKIWFQKVVSLLEDDAVLVGHSLGGIFLVKFLNEGRFPVRVRATFLIAAPFHDDLHSGESLASFALLGDTLTQFLEHAGAVYLYQSTDDTVVDVSHMKEYQKVLRGATVRLFDDRGHFNLETLPELVEDILAL